jgi:hypothetical protein
MRLFGVFDPIDGHLHYGLRTSKLSDDSFVLNVLHRIDCVVAYTEEIEVSE